MGLWYKDPIRFKRVVRRSSYNVKTAIKRIMVFLLTQMGGVSEKDLQRLQREGFKNCKNKKKKKVTFHSDESERADAIYEPDNYLNQLDDAILKFNASPLRQDQRLQIDPTRVVPQKNPELAKYRRCPTDEDESIYDQFIFDPDNRCDEDDQFYLHTRPYENTRRITHSEDVVRRVNQLRTDPDAFKGDKIRHIYDTQVKPNCMPKKCLKNPTVDNPSGDGFYYAEAAQNTQTIAADRWAYENEAVMNGGHISNNIYGFDPMDDQRQAV